MDTKAAFAIVRNHQEGAAVDMLRSAHKCRMPMKTRLDHIRIERLDDGGTEIFWGNGEPPSLELFEKIREARS